ncbi:hypothetical protein DFQ12_5076 [Sphingobacterium detergens]|uniref:Uncharacterized protein n=1 Tax=Sphingobacterium detergens TaxID=1145106 RepID=A0A420AG07_SPHD1|nr:hypothetical protein DFQ12_5076 [Sphingobacterium detergens]
MPFCLNWKGSTAKIEYDDNNKKAAKAAFLLLSMINAVLLFL